MGTESTVPEERNNVINLFVNFKSKLIQILPQINVFFKTSLLYSSMDKTRSSPHIF